MSSKMKKKLKKESSVKPDIEYDDDTSSSDSDSETLQMFHQSYVSKETSSTRKFSSSDADDEVNENTSNDEDGTSDDNSDESSDDEESEPQKESSTQNNRINSKMDNLRSQLRSLSKVNKNDDISQVEQLKSERGQKPSLNGNSKENSPDNIKISTANVHSQKDKVSNSQYNRDSLKSQEPALDTEKLEIRAELSNMSMEEILQLKEKLGSKLYNSAIGVESSSTKETKKFKNKKDEMKRDNKNRPREMSSKKTVKRFRDVVGLSAELQTDKRDPRFDNMCGEFDEKMHRDAYKFVEDIKSKELHVLKDELKTETEPERIEQIKYLIQRIENQSREKKKVEKEKTALVEKKKHNRQLLKDGKMPEFVSKQEEKSRSLIEKYEELKKSDKLEQYMKKKNKKNVSKDRKQNKTFGASELTRK